MPTCLTNDELTAILSDRLDPQQMLATEAHLDECERCQQSLLDLSEDSDQRERRQNMFHTEDVTANGSADTAPPAEFMQALKSIVGRFATEASPPSEWPNIPDYEILGELGHGGTAVVYQARQLSLHRIVALKVILPGEQLHPDRLARFRAEAGAVARLQHPNIIQIHQVGEASGLPYLSLEYIDGGNLALKAAGMPQPPREAAELVERLARAIHFAHEHSVIHRDLKPANVLLTKEGVPKIADFGLAKSLAADGAAGVSKTLTQSGDVLGTPRYMAPEQAGPAGVIGPATDVYGLGVILYELLAGRPPFQAETALQTLLQVLNDEPRTLCRQRSDLSRDLEVITLKCLDKDPSRRYSSGLELAAHLQRYLSGEPIRARPISQFERARKWARRRPAVAASLAGIVVVSVAAFAAVLFAFLGARSAQQNEAHQRQVAERSVYFGNIAQARSQWLLNNVSGAARLLEQCQPEHRGWEWHYLQSLNSAAQLTIPKAGEPNINALAISHDGRLIAVAGGNPFSRGMTGAIRVYDPVGRLRWEHTSPDAVFWGVAFSPDGRLVAGTSGHLFSQGPGNVAVWDSDNGALMRRFTGIEKNSPRGITFSPDGQTLAAACKDKSVHLWRVSDGQTIGQLKDSQDLESVTFSPDGKLLAVGGASYATLWNAATHQLLGQLPHSGPLVAISPNGKLLASTNASKANVWDISQLSNTANVSALPLVQSLARHDGAILDSSFSPDSISLATAGADSTVRTWDLTSGLEQTVYRGHHGRASAVLFHTNGRCLITGGQQPGDLKIWDLTRQVEYRVPISFSGENRDIEAMAFADDQTLIALGRGGTLKTWDPKSDQTAEKPPITTSTEWLVPASTVTISRDGRRMVTVPDKQTNNVVKVWDIARNLEIGVMPSHQYKVWHTALDAIGNRVATASFGRHEGHFKCELRVWDVVQDRAMFEEIFTDQQTQSLALSPDGTMLVVALRRMSGPADAMEQEIFLINLIDPNATKTKLPGLTGPTRALAFSANGRRLAGADDGGDVIIWDTADGHASHNRPLKGLTGIAALAFSPDSTRLSGVNRERVQLWDVQSGQDILVLRGAGQRPFDNGFNPRIAWSHDGVRLAVSNWDRTVSVWTGRSEKRRSREIRSVGKRSSLA